MNIEMYGSKDVRFPFFLVCLFFVVVVCLFAFFRDSTIFTLFNSGTICYGGFLVFSVLGFMAQNQGRVPVDKVAKSGEKDFRGFVAKPVANLINSCQFKFIILHTLGTLILTPQKRINWYYSRSVRDLTCGLYSKEEKLQSLPLFL